jgi:hypothetical protein
MTAMAMMASAFRLDILHFLFLGRCLKAPYQLAALSTIFNGKQMSAHDSSEESEAKLKSAGHLLSPTNL